MTSLKDFINEALIQPDEIGHQTDGLFRMIEYGSNLSIVQNAKTRQQRIEQAANSISKQIEKTTEKKS